MVKAWKEQVVIPTYEVGKPEKNPMFLENRVYQGSSGVVYPYPVIERISDEKKDHTYNAVFLENEYLKIMILPELGGRVQMAYDKIKQRHFVYYNHVIKPALVGLVGPWISGGIEFNWPQHHRPSTFMPVDCDIEEFEDGSVTVWVSETERMFHQKGMAGFTLRPGKAFLEIKGVLYNRTETPQTFLWWANPAVAVNDHYQSVFPPDVNAVFDHGKRDVSTFPIATGTYYKIDYSAGVDISNYRNLPVPTSYMAINSRFNFVGGYENDTHAGVLHVANHHVSPGKKQWTWGNGDFGRAWDRNLTDEDGPYIELMAGVYTDNQPDFTWLQPPVACSGFGRSGAERYEPCLCGILCRSERQPADGLLRAESKGAAGAVCQWRQLRDGGIWADAVDAAEPLPAPNGKRGRTAGQPLQRMRKARRLPGNLYGSKRIPFPAAQASNGARLCFEAV